MHKKSYLRFCLLEVSFWCLWASYISYISPYFLDKGIANTYLSIILSVYYFVSFLGSFFWGRVSDYLNGNRIIIIIGTFLALIFGHLVYFNADNFLLAGILYPIFGFMFVPLTSMIDAWIIKSYPERKDAFGKARACGSTSYSIMMLLNGQLISRIGYSIIPVMLTIFAVMQIILAFSLPEEKEEIEGEGISLKDMKELTHNKTYFRLFMIVLVAAIAIQPMNNMKMVYIQNVGAGVSEFGIDSFVGCIMQVPFLFMAGKIRKYPIKSRLLVTTVTSFITAFLIMIAKVWYVITLGTIIHFLGYGILLATYKEVTEDVVPRRLRNTGHSLMDAAYGSAACVISLSYAGMVIDHFGIPVLMIVCMVIQAIAITMVLRFPKVKGEG